MKAESPSFYLDTQGLNSLKNAARSDSRDPETVRQVASQFESLYLNMVLKSMREASPGDGLFDSDQTLFFRDMMDKQVAVDMAQSGGIGLGDLLARQLAGPAPVNLDASEALVSGLPPRPFKGLPLERSSTPLSLSGETPRFMPLDEARLDSRWRLAPPPPLSERQQAVLAQAKVDVPASVVSSTMPPASAAQVAPTSATPSGPDKAGPWQAPEDFIRDLWPHAQRVADKLGVPAEAIVAQSALETGWGRKLPLHADGSSSYNLFGIKADARWSGDRLKVDTLEFEGEQFVSRREPFRAYGGLAEAVDDYGEFLAANPRYQQALAAGDDGRAFARELQAAGYATDPAYARKIVRIIEGDTLASGLAALKRGHPEPTSS